MKILHVSDLHIADNGAIIWDTDTLHHFNVAIDIIRDMRDISAIIVTGDISDDGSYWSYKYVDEAFESTGIQTICCPGNHDDKQMMGNGYKFQFISTEQKTVINGWKFITLDTSIVGMSRGLIDESQMLYLIEELKSDNLPTVIAFHHPTIEAEGWLNSKKIVDNRGDFNALVEKYNNVKLVLYGHIHYSSQHKFGDTLFCSAPSVGYAFDPQLPKFQIATGHEAFNLISLDLDDIKITTIKIFDTEK